ncbi:MAG: nucleoside triphosphate pyrophosphohydrolase [Acidimicrobiia bacterium]|nr:nucleoside triphosphate pyrophosphohydrolase [Acidimicrobiia bacterium]
MITIVGLGPGDLDRVPEAIRSILLEPAVTVVCRTVRHPAAEQLAAIREVLSCDDLYEAHDSYPDIYAAIRDRVLTIAESGDVIYAVPGSPRIGEFAVSAILDSGAQVDVVPSESFIDAVLAEVGYDPLDRGIQLINAHDPPDPLVLDKPTIIAHLDRPEVLADFAARLDRVLPDGATVTVLVGLGSGDQQVVEGAPASLDPGLAGNRTSMFVDSPPGGLIGAVRVMRRLREECPWDKEQTHESLVKNLVEEAYELIDAISHLPDSNTDWIAYSTVEDELGDVLLQVLFHSAIARQSGVFDIDDVAESLRRKLVRRHPHVYGGVSADTPEQVKANWDLIKERERDDRQDASSLAGVPAGMPSLHRAAKIQTRAAKAGFDWSEASEVLPKISEELDELAAEVDSDGEVDAELGDLLFSVVNLARHLGIDPEISLRSATARFEERFRHMEAEGPLSGLTLGELEERWQKAKRR